MKAIKIDVVKQDIYEVELKPGIKGIYEQLECDCFCVGYRFDVSMVDRRRLEDAVYVDDEGLLKEERLGYFTPPGSIHPLTGHGLVVGTSLEGDSIPPLVTVAWLKERIKFFKPDEIVPPEPFMEFTPLDSSLPLNQAVDKASKEVEAHFKKEQIRPVPGGKNENDGD